MVKSAGNHHELLVKGPKIPRKRRGVPPLSPARLAELAALGALPAPPRAGREDAPWRVGVVAGEKYGPEIIGKSEGNMENDGNNGNN